MRKARSLTHPLAILLFSVFALNLPDAQAATATRSSSFVYDTASGLLTREIIEPNNPQLCLVTEYTYDAFGNKLSVTTRNCNGGSAGEAAAPAAGSDAVIAPRTTSSTYDAKGQFALSTTNALGHTENRTFDTRFGGVASLTGPNGLKTSWSYDSFGRKIQENRADSTWTTWGYFLYNCAGCYAPMPNIRYYVQTTQSGIAQSSYTFYDTLNRKVLAQRRNMNDSDWIDEGNTVYDGNGRVVKTYLPYESNQFAGAKSATVIYDQLGRPISQIAADGGTSTMSYAGLTTTVSNSLNQTKTTVKNSQGQTVRIIDAQNKTIDYSYDPFGNLLTTTDALGNVTRLIYDARGRKMQMNDPDMGIWSYAYNALGELIRQVDAKNQTVTMQYDKLGRMVSRNEPDLNSTWSYDSAAHGIGKLASATSGNGYSRTHSYDALGRLSSTSTVIDTPTPYVTGTSYDSSGRVLTQTYPASASYPTGFAVRNVYNANGYLIEVRNAASNALLWQANIMDAAGHLTRQTYGNGLVTDQVFDPATGRVVQQLVGAGGAVQNMSYQYDTLGNLKTRQDVNSSLNELYQYDPLNRVTSATANSGAVNTVGYYAYDALGNITSKSDVGGYIYNAGGPNSVRPHAVSQITGTVNGIVNPTFAYDANGNLTSGAGRTVTWSSFNIPSQISNQTPAGIKTAAFWYNPEHERTKELQADQSIVITLSPRYDTGLHFEKKYIAANGVLTGAVEYEHYLYAGGLMFGKYITTTATDGVTLAGTAMEYYSKDNLGSIVAITDDTGAVKQRLSYDVWGKRRYPNGAADPNGLLNNPDMYHGYTGHEMLDAVGLIHMNGRLYDPVMARFVSADPNIQAPESLQSYNRYSYVWNNPLSSSDPSGYFRLFGINITPRVIVAAVAAYYTGGLVGGWAMGTSSLTAITVTSTSCTLGLNAVGAALVGASAGFAGSMVMTNGDINASLKGAMASGLTGGVAGAFAQVGTLGQMIGGGLNGYLQTGTADGFARGFAAGAIPQNLGLKAYNDYASANLVIGIVRDGIRGGLVSGNSKGVMPGIAYGQFNNALGHLIGMVTTGALPTFKNGIFSYTDKSNIGFWGQRGALTVGNVISGPKDLMTMPTDTGVSVYAHELDHIKNPVEKSLGALYGPAHVFDLAVGNVGYKLGQGANWFILEEHVQQYPYSSMGLYQK